MHTTFSPASLAGRLARLTGGAFVILEIQNSGDHWTLAQALPSLDDDQLDIAQDGVLIIGYDTVAEAQNAFNALTLEARTGHEATAAMVETTVRYVGEISGTIMTTSNGSGPSWKFTNTHVFDEGRLLSVDAVKRPQALDPSEIVERVPTFLGMPFDVPKSASGKVAQ